MFLLRGFGRSAARDEVGRGGRKTKEEVEDKNDWGKVSLTGPSNNPPFDPSCNTTTSYIRTYRSKTIRGGYQKIRRFFCSFRHRSETTDVPGRDVTGEWRGRKG
jgi:hypothetical protein